MGHGHHRNVDDRHTDKEIAGVQHGGLGQGQTGRIHKGQQKIEPHRDLELPHIAAAHDVFALVKGKKVRI